MTYHPPIVIGATGTTAAAGAAGVWSFGAPQDSETAYADGTRVPHRAQVVYLDGVAVGEIEIHLHRRGGRDRIADLSYGITAIAYGPLPGGA